MNSNRSKIIRTFIALDVAEEVRRYIADIQKELRSVREAKVAWAQPSGVHLTLKFLGGVPEDRLDNIAAVIEKSVQSFAPLTIKTSDHSAFPNLKRPRVLFVGLEQNGELNHLQQVIETNLAELGFETEDKPFKPHLTVGRVKSIATECSLGERFQAIKPLLFSWTVNQANLMSSILLPAAARYSVIKSLTFGIKGNS